jgi:N-methylhydantoinase A
MSEGAVVSGPEKKGRFTLPSAYTILFALLSDYRVDLNVTRVRPLTPGESKNVAGDLLDLEAKARRELAEYGIGFERVEIHYRLDIRYEGQEHTISVELPASSLAAPDDFAAVARRPFVQLHRRLYGHGEPHGPIELVACRCRAVGMTNRPSWRALAETGDGRPKGRRDVHFAGRGRRARFRRNRQPLR